MERVTERLILREFRADDWVHTQRYESDPEVVRYQTFNIFTPEESRDYIQRCMSDAQALTRRTYDLAITIQGDDIVVGRIGLHLSHPELGQATVWYLLRRDLWGQGYMTEALASMLDLAFKELKLRRVIADTDPANAGSIRVLEKVGFRQESHHIENIWIKGKWCDTLGFAILDREWLVK
jgi:RimJ/RimL family protein N-acetyltransferase